MENKDKLRHIIEHWITHNHGHTQEFKKWQNLMVEEDKPIADKLKQVIVKTEEINNLLQTTLEEAGGPTGHSHHH